MLRVNDPLPFGANRVAWARSAETSGRATRERPRLLLSLASPSSFFSNATRRDVTAMLRVCIRSAKGRCTRTSGRQDAQRIFAGRAALSPLANSLVPPLRSHTSFPPPDSSRLRSVLYPRGGQPLLFIPYPLFFILYIPVCLGRQTRVPRMA